MQPYLRSNFRGISSHYFINLNLSIIIHHIFKQFSLGVAALGRTERASMWGTGAAASKLQLQQLRINKSTLSGEDVQFCAWMLLYSLRRLARCRRFLPPSFRALSQLRGASSSGCNAVTRPFGLHPRIPPSFLCCCCCVPPSSPSCACAHTLEILAQRHKISSHISATINIV